MDLSVMFKVYLATCETANNRIYGNFQTTLNALDKNVNLGMDYTHIYCGVQV